jgi:cysteine-rich repeat protein
MEEGEECDDGNTTDGDGCDSDCVIETCGNGKVQAGEQCDDGPSGSDTCTSSCTTISCGDGKKEGAEECDLGADNGVEDSGCSSDCKIIESPPPPPPSGCPADMGVMGSGYEDTFQDSCGHKGVMFHYLKPETLDLDDLDVLAELTDFRDMFINIESADENTVTFNAINPFKGGEFLMFVQVEAPITDDSLATGHNPRQPVCIGDPDVGECEQVDPATIEAVCVTAGTEPYAWVNVYFAVPPGRSVDLGGESAEVHPCCEAGDSIGWKAGEPNPGKLPAFSFHFTISCNCPVTGRRLRGSN